MVDEDFSHLPESEGDEQRRWWASWTAIASIAVVSIFVILLAIAVWWFLATYPEH